MSDLDLYRLILRYCSEYHEDGIFFIAPWDLKDFVQYLGIKDSENGVPATITTDGFLAVDTHEFESWFEEDIEEIIKRLNEDINVHLERKY